MRLTHAQVLKYKSIEDSGKVPIDEKVTVLVGINEAGKSAFLEALYKARPVVEGPHFNYISDYPRKELVPYERRHDAEPARVVMANFHWRKMR